MFIHDSLSELVVCGETEVAAADLRVKMNRLRRPAPGDPSRLTGFQTQFQVVCVCVCVCVHWGYRSLNRADHCVGKSIVPIHSAL